ncbi:hypothetical protein [Ectobacillus ponti]|uniref:Uncharacterized protein n=1 Tax=Ectobacillus ponti TaxID=2961894 RepID=A0AA41X333_9BACI|nr:hypothetical protein [Ectobacillus ponti]MCP8968046.1 hypothetical protein [Ectobacillus ponti]
MTKRRVELTKRTEEAQINSRILLAGRGRYDKNGTMILFAVPGTKTFPHQRKEFVILCRIGMLTQRNLEGLGGKGE